MVSIIVPVYNIRQYLPQCVESLLGQREKNMEVLLVDDGSTDGSGDLCDALAATDSRIRVIHKENGGLSDARNAGLDHARGTWILFVDGDDYLAPDAVELLLREAREDADFVQFLYHETEDGKWLPDPGQDAAAEVCTDNHAMWQWLYEKGGVAASSCTKLWNRRVFETERYRKGILYEDEELLNRVLPHCTKVVYTQLELYGYLMRPDSIVHATFKPKQMDIFETLEHRIAVLEKLGHRELVRKTRERQFMTALLMFGKARKAKAPHCTDIKKRLMTYAKAKGLQLQGQYRLVYTGCRIFPGTPELYFWVRKICRKQI